MNVVSISDNRGESSRLNRFGPFTTVAAARGHLARGLFRRGVRVLDLAFSPLADFHQSIEATCLVTGKQVTIEPMQYEVKHDPTAPEARIPAHPVLKAALTSGSCPPAVAELIRDWGERDPVDAMHDARLLLRAIRDGDDLDRTDVSRAARRAHHDFTKHYSMVEGVAYASRLADVLTEWADVVLAEMVAEVEQ